MLKWISEHLLITAGAERRGLRAHRGRTLVLAFHNIVPEGQEPTGDRSLHLPVTSFRRQLDALARTHDIVALGARDEPATGRPRAIITFDDAYRGALTAGRVELEARGLPWTMFVAPGILGDRTTWWDALADPRTGELDPRLRERCLTELSGDADRVLAMAGVERLPVRTMPPWARTASEDELAAAVAGGMTTGAHSWRHPNLAALDRVAVEVEVRRALDWLRERFPVATLPYLAYPYGLVTPAAEDAARHAGCSGALLISGGYCGASAPPMRLPRLNVPSGVSLAGFRLRTAGVLGKPT